MTPDDVAKQISDLQLSRTRLESSVNKKRGDLLVLRNDYARLLAQAKEEFACDSPEALTALVEKLAEATAQDGARLANALALYEQGNFAAAARVLGTGDTT
jgi:hypothetical protein